MMLLHTSVLSLLLGSIAASGLRPAPVGRRQSTGAGAPTAHNLSVPVDHFHNDSRYEPHSDAYFNLRYWFEPKYYKPGGPVIVLQGGETSGAGRVPFLEHGIVSELANATGGMGVVLEHRYYGTSFPTADLETENLRFLTTDQAVADQAYFAKHIVFPGYEHLNLQAPGTPYFAYGGSYAGAFVAILRKLYPDVYWGAISSSGVTEAYYDFWQYYEPIRKYGDRKCIDTHTKLVNIADQIYYSHNKANVRTLQKTFGAPNITYFDDFMAQYASGPGYWQVRNWDPAVNDPTWNEYCADITSTTPVSNNTNLEPTVRALIAKTTWGLESRTLVPAMLNLISWFADNVLAYCDPSQTQDECFGSHDPSLPRYSDKSVSNYNSLSWAYQYCTEWGFLQSGSTVPWDRLPLISRTMSVAWNELVCENGYNISKPSDVQRVNKFGGYTFSYPRLAIIGGEADPWRPVTPLADRPLPDSHEKTDRKLEGDSTVSEPLIIIPGAVHHWDENGVYPNQTNATFPPPSIQKAKAQLIDAAQSWMQQWKDHCAHGGNCTFQY